MTERLAWDRRDGESARAYAAFRRFREAGPLRTLAAAVSDGIGARSVGRWSARFDWSARAVAWDDELHQRADRQRLEAIRAMHDTHQRAARAAIAKALGALSVTAPEDIPPAAAARLLELGTKLERDTLTVSVEALQGLMPTAPTEDPWDKIARELQGGDPDADAALRDTPPT